MLWQQFLHSISNLVVCHIFWYLSIHLILSYMEWCKKKPIESVSMLIPSSDPPPLL